MIKDPNNMRRCLLLVCLAMSLPVGCFAQAAGGWDEGSEQERRRTEWLFQQRATPQGFVPAGVRLQALRDMDAMQGSVAKGPARAASATPWTGIGPFALATPFWLNPISGRIDAIATDPRNSKVIYIGASEGGVWKSTDGGVNWVPLADSQASLAIGSIALDPANPDIVYAGTGSEIYGAGILKSTDGGASWTNYPGPFVGPFGTDSVFGGGTRIYSLAVSPADSNVVLAGVWRYPLELGGIFRSGDGGVTWKQVLSGPGRDVLFVPSSGRNAFATLASSHASPAAGLYQSKDGGQNWMAVAATGPSALPQGLSVSEQRLAISRSNPSTMYVSILSRSGSPPRLYKSLDGGTTWTLQAPLPANCCSPIAVHPTDPNLVIGGATFPGSVFRSLDGGANWTDLTGITVLGFLQAVHADNRFLFFTPDGASLYDGCDGGLYRTGEAHADPLPWVSLNARLAISQFYPSISIHPTDPNISIGGTQDNGTIILKGSQVWGQSTCGDAGWSAIDPVNPATMYTTCQAIDIQKSVSGGAVGTWNEVRGGIVTSDRVSFIPPLVMDPSNTQTLYFGTFRLYRTTNGANLWTAISPDLTGGADTISTIAVAPNAPNTVYVGTTGGHIQVSVNALSAVTATWTRCDKAPLPPRFLTQIVVDPKNALTAYATFSGFTGFADKVGHVFKTADGCATWTDISGNLPNIPVNDLVLDPDVANAFYLGTDLGVFGSFDSGASWSVLGSGLPRTMVNSLKLHRPSRTLRAATYGRGMFDLAVPVGVVNPAPTVTAVSPASAPVGSIGVRLKISGRGFTWQSLVRWNGANRATTVVSPEEVDVIPSDSDLATVGVSNLGVVTAAPGGGTSTEVNFSVTPNVIPAGATNAASFASGISPGALATVFGHGLTTGVQGIVGASSLPLPTQINGTSVTVNGVAAPIFAIANINGQEQINIQVPVEAAGHSTAGLTVINNGVSITVQVQVLAAQPAVYSYGRANGIVAHNDTGQLITAALPTKPGEYVIVYANALGPLDVPPATGAVADPSRLSNTIERSSLTIGGIPATVFFSGLTPGSIGLYQITTQIPDGVTPSSVVPLVVSAGGINSPTVTIPVAAR